MKLRVLLVEDEAPARKRFLQLLEPYTFIESIAQVKDLASARQYIAEQPIDLVFLDIHLGSENGFDLLPYLPAKTRVVFVTAYPEFALRAFDSQALDYLLKPVSSSRLQQTLERVSSTLLEPEAATVVPERLQLDDPIVLQDSTTWTCIPLKNVSLIRASGDYSELFGAKETPCLHNRNLKDWVDCLPSPPFHRIDRAHIVNVTQIAKFHSHSRKRGVVTFQNVSGSIELGRTASGSLKKILRSIG